MSKTPGVKSAPVNYLSQFAIKRGKQFLRGFSPIRSPLPATLFRKRKVARPGGGADKKNSRILLESFC